MNAHSLSTRIAFLLGISMVLVVGAAAVIMDQMVDTEMVQRFDDTLLTQARTLVALVSVDTASATMKNTRSPRDSVFRGETSGTFDIQCKNGDRISSDPGAPRYPGEWKAEATQEPIFDDVTVDEVTWRTVRYQFDALTQQNTGDTGKLSAATSVASRACTIVLMQPRTKLDEMLDTIDAILLLTPMAALIVVLLLSPRLVRRGLKPLALLAAQMRHVGPQAVEQRLTGTGTRELEPLIARFNEVLERMSDGMQRERQFASALAHETRTRLAELRALVDVEQLYPGERSTRELLDEVGNIGGELESIVSALLLLTRLDAGIESLQMRPVDLDEHVARQLQRIAATLHARNLQ
ncbi:MAG TPA: sensor histidine kinase N-terminal domain-containing protein, partial [Rudaea sp.]|nr:sensor histidine kinase N-terminal domain-containing protein [Rudaea sp.]